LETIAECVAGQLLASARVRYGRFEKDLGRSLLVGCVWLLLRHVACHRVGSFKLSSWRDFGCCWINGLMEWKGKEEMELAEELFPHFKGVFF
jgi:hypothetical protein